jgi:replicative DNA helicase
MHFENEKVERQVLAAMMLSSEDRLTALQTLPTLDCFQVDAHRVIARAIQAQQDAGEPVDLETTVATIKKSGLIKEAGGVRNVANIYGTVIAFGHLEAHCRLLTEHYLKAKLHMLSLELLQKAQSDSGDVFETFAEYQLKFDNLLASSITRNDDDFLQQLEVSAKQWLNSKPGEIAGYRTGIASLDTLCGGLHNGELTIVGARPGQGKTALVVTLIRNLAMQEISCGMLSLEMTKHELVQRLASQESNVFAYRIKQGELTPFDKSNIQSAVQRMKSWPIKISDEGYLNISKIRTKATMWKNKYNMKVLFLDYIGLVNSVNPKETNRVNIVGEISRGLKMLAKELNIPIIALSQLSRRVEERSDKMPLMSDLRESGSVEQDADVIWMMMRPEYYFEHSATTKVGSTELGNAGLCLIDQVKMRSGSTGIIPLRFDAPLMRLKDYNE